MLRPRKYLTSVIYDTSGNAWQLGERLGSGCNGQVYAATTEGHPGLKVAVKVFEEKRSYMTELHIYINVFSEAHVAEYKLAREIDHIGCPKLYGYGKHNFEDSSGAVRKHPFIVIERLLPLMIFQPLSTAAMCAHLLNTLTFIHSYGWAHCDFTTSNAMVDEDGKFYLVDFGEAEYVHNHNSELLFHDYWGLIHTLANTLRWPSPAGVVLEDDPVFTSSSGSLFSLPGELKNWAIDSFVGGPEVQIFNVLGGKHQARLRLSEEIYSIYKELNTIKSHYYTDTGIFADERFIITPQYSQPIDQKYINDISNRLFVRMVKCCIAKLGRLHKFGYCHNNIHPGNVLFNPTTNHFILDDFSKATKIQGPSTVMPSNYTGLDSYKFVSSPRSDLDSIVFCMLYWAGVTLPWAHIEDPEQLHVEKIKFMGNPDSLLNSIPSVVKRKLIKKIILLNTLTPLTALPKYSVIKLQLNSALQSKLDNCATYCSDTQEGGCPSCINTLIVKDALILGLPDERNKQAIAAFKYSNLW